MNAYEDAEIGDPEAFPEGTHVTVQVSGTLTGYMDHLGNRMVKGSYIAWNGAEIFYQVDVPANAVVIGVTR